LNGNIIPGALTTRLTSSAPQGISTWTLPSEGWGITTGINTLVFKTLNIYAVETSFIASLQIGTSDSSYRLSKNAVEVLPNVNNAVLGVTTVLGVFSTSTGAKITGIIGVTTVLGTSAGSVGSTIKTAVTVTPPTICLMEYDTSGTLIASLPLTLVPSSYSYQISATQIAKSASDQIVWRGTAMHYFSGSSSAVPSTSKTICANNDVVAVPVVYEIFCWSPPTTTGSASLVSQNLGSLAVTLFPTATDTAIISGASGTASIMLFISFPVCPTGDRNVASPDAAGMGAGTIIWNCGTFVPSQSNIIPPWVRTLVFTLPNPCSTNMIMNPTGLVFNTSKSLGPYISISTISLTDTVLCNQAMIPIVGSVRPTDVLGSGATGTLGLVAQVLGEFNHINWNLTLVNYAYSDFAMVLYTSSMFITFMFLGPDPNGYFYGVCYILTLTNSIILTLTRYFYEKYTMINNIPTPQWNGTDYSFDPQNPVAPVCGASDLSVIVVQNQPLSGNQLKYTFTFPSYQPTDGRLYGGVDFISPVDPTLSPGYVYLGNITYNSISPNNTVTTILSGTSPS